VPDLYIPYSEWQGSYMTGVDVGTLWLGKFVAVCDPDLPPTRSGKPGYVPQRRSGEVLLTPDEAVRHAGDGLRAHGLLDQVRYRAEFEDANAAEPVLVQRLDRIDSFYYIVPLQTAGVTALIILVNARTGEFMQSAIRAAEKDDLLADWVDRSAASKLVIGKKVDLPEDSGAIHFRPEATCQSPALVWKPCRESYSPLYPFHLFTTGAPQIYVRTDGEVFTELHDGGRGE